MKFDQAVKKLGTTKYRIAKDTGLSYVTLIKVRNEENVNLQTLELLTKVGLTATIKNGKLVWEV